MPSSGHRLARPAGSGRNANRVTGCRDKTGPDGMRRTGPFRRRCPHRGFRSGWLRRGRKIEHVLHLSHMADLNPVEDIYALLHGVDCVTVEIRGALLELGEVFHRTQAALGAMNLLIKEAAQADGIKA